MRRTARLLLTLPETSQRRQLEGAALMRRVHDLGILESDKDKLDYVLTLTVPDILERHIAVAKQLVTVPSFLVRTSQEGHIGLADSSPLAPNAQRMGRVKRMKAKAAKNKEDDE